MGVVGSVVSQKFLLRSRPSDTGSRGICSNTVLLRSRPSVMGTVRTINSQSHLDLDQLKVGAVGFVVNQLASQSSVSLAKV